MTDEEYLNKLSTIQIYCEVLLGILRHIPGGKIINDKELIQKLKFENKDDHLRLRACIDLIEDTEFAILEFHENGLETKSCFSGEHYLRLYGILNALYLQMQAVIDLIELFKIPNKKQIMRDLKTLEIIDVRNKVGAHTTNYSNDFKDSRNKSESYRVSQNSISKWGEEIVLVSSYNQIEKYNLVPLINQFSDKINSYLKLICDKAIKSLYKNESENKSWLIYRLSYARYKSE